MAVAPPFYGVEYADCSGLGEGRGAILGVIGYGVDRPSGIGHAPFAKSGLEIVDGMPRLEIWRAAGPVSYHRLGAVSGARSRDCVFGLVEVEERAGVPFDDAIEQAYRAIRDYLEETGGFTPTRFWNYLPRITDDEDGLERYRRFNIGRHRVFADWPAVSVPPAASGLGSAAGKPLIYFLAATGAALAIDNPRQVAAYRYPSAYGPQSPDFSRAALHEEALFISGTASIVGHESRHLGDLDGQIDEVLENIRAIMGEAALAGHDFAEGKWLLKLYLRQPEYQVPVKARIAAFFGAEADCLYLRADICRRDLLVEVEALHRKSAL